MGLKHLTDKFAVKVGNYKEKAVLVCLAFHKNDKSGQCNPGIGLIAEECELSRPTVIKCLKSLEAKGIIKIVRNGRTSHYLWPHESLLQKSKKPDESTQILTSEVKTPSSKCRELEGNLNELEVNEDALLAARMSWCAPKSKP